MSEKLKVKRIEIAGVKYFIDNENNLYDTQTKELIGLFNRKTNTIEETDEYDAFDLEKDNFADEKDWNYIKQIKFAITDKPNEDNDYSITNQNGDIVSYVSADDYDGEFEDLIDIGMPVNIDIQHTYPDVVEVFADMFVGYKAFQKEGSNIFEFPMYWTGTISFNDKDMDTEKIDTDINLEEPVGRIKVEIDLGEDIPDIDDYSNEDLQGIVRDAINNNEYQPVIKSKVVKDIEDDFLNKVSLNKVVSVEKPKKVKKSPPPPATPIEPPIDELTSKKNEYKSFFKIFKEKKAEYDANKTKELKKELLQMKAKADKFLLEIEALKERKVGTGYKVEFSNKNGVGIDNAELYEKAKEIVYKQYPKHSAYRSGQLVKKYKEMGGTYSGKKDTDGLTRWFKEEWKDIGNKEYPVYRPTKRITKDTPLIPEEIKPSNLRSQIVLKQKIKGNENLPPFLPLGKVERKKAELNGAGVYSLGQSANNISQYDEIYKYSNPKKVQELAKKYLGEGGIIYRSIKKDKKYMVYNPNTKKWVHFGQMKYEDFTKHKDEKRRKNYLTRSANIKGDWKNDKYSPNNLSRNLLW